MMKSGSQITRRNERTYLAWIRTAIAVMAFGFVIEKFDLFIRYLGHAVNDSGHPRPSEWAELFGLLFIGVSILMFLVSTSPVFRLQEGDRLGRSEGIWVKGHEHHGGPSVWFFWSSSWSFTLA